jgi:hypothetical protein
MKNIIKILSLTAVLAVASVSCDLNRYPYDSIEQSKAFMTIKDATTLNNGLYAGFRGVVYGLYQFSTDVQADLLNATLDYGNRNGFPHKWTPFLADDYTIRDTWRYQYNVIANANNVINNSGRITVTNHADSLSLKRYLGDAYLMRAYLYHQLILRFAKDYEPASAATDPGVPIVLTFDPSLKPARSTVQKVYDLILEDLAGADTLLAATAGAKNSTRFTKDCVTALKARVYLCMHRYTDAVTAANSLITSGTYPLITTLADLQNMWVNDGSTTAGGAETIFQLAAIQPSELGNANNIYLGFNPANNKYTPDFVPEQWVISQYEVADIRRATYLAQEAVIVQGVDYPNLWCINKYPGNPILFIGASTNYQHKPKIFRVAEMYLISAEAAAQAPATEAAALTTLNLLRSARGASTLVGLTGTALMDAIKAERIRELLCEGTRIDDLKRWHMGFARSTPQNVGLLIVDPDFTGKVVAAGDDKFVWGIPANDMTTNPSLVGQQNPGW